MKKHIIALIRVTSELNVECRVGGGYDNPAISKLTEGETTIPSAANGYKITSTSSVLLM